MDIANDAIASFAGEAGTIPVVGNQGVDAPASTTTSNTLTQKFYTEADLARVRSQEKEKLYPTIESLKGEVDALKQEKLEREAKKSQKESERAKKEQEKLAEKEKMALEKDLSAKDLLRIKEREWEEKLERERQERELAFSLLEKERALADLQSYRIQRLDAERENIVPELVDLITGNTAEEVEASINDLKGRSQSILENARAMRDSARRDLQGTKVSLPPTGPLETDSAQRQLSAAEIANMDMSEYAKYRTRILSSQAQGRTQGMFS
jgi:hypothetical protein